MANIEIDYNNLKLKSKLYANGYLESLIFKNFPKEINFFRIKGIFVFGADKDNKIVTTNNYHIDTLPNNIDLTYFGELDLNIGKRKIAKKVDMSTDINKINETEVEDMKKYFPNVTHIKRIILDIAFYEDDKEIQSFHLTTNILEDIKFKNIVKIESGLLEKNNPLLFSKLSDFFGDGSFFRDDEKFTITNGYVERNFSNEKCVLIIHKQNNTLYNKDRYGIYTRNKGRRSGIIECVENGIGNQKTATHWKLIHYDNFIQTYISYDDMNEWIATGGGENVEKTNIQGFFVDSDTSLVVKDYKVYKTPYTKFLNIPDGYYVKIYDKNNVLKLQKRATNGMVEIYMPMPIEKGYFTVCNEKEIPLYTSEIIDIDLGDIFNDLKYELEVYYGNTIIERYSTTNINRIKERIKVKNVSNKEYNNIEVFVEKNEDNIDEILLSIDNKSYLKTVKIDKLEPNHIKYLYIQINKNNSKSNFGKKFFGIRFI